MTLDDIQLAGDLVAGVAFLKACGTLTVPRGTPNAPAVLLSQGLGLEPFDRDVSTTGVESRGFAWRAVNELQHRLRYSARNVSTGSALSAWLAGCQAAKVARASSATAAAVNVIVSNGSTPCKRP